jgi:Rv0623-like transcription factor
MQRKQLNVRDPRASALAELLARMRGQTMTEATICGLEADMREEKKDSTVRTPSPHCPGLTRQSWPEPARDDARRDRRQVGTLMFVYTSAFIAILAGEPVSASLAKAIEEAQSRCTSPAGCR